MQLASFEQDRRSSSRIRLERFVVQILEETLTLNACIVDENVEPASCFQMSHCIGHTLGASNTKFQHFGRVLRRSSSARSALLFAGVRMLATTA
jgi:hypothetical protein